MQVFSKQRKNGFKECRLDKKLGLQDGSQPTLNRIVYIYEKTAQLNVGHFGHMLTVTTVFSEADGNFK